MHSNRLFCCSLVLFVGCCCNSNRHNDFHFSFFTSFLYSDIPNTEYTSITDSQGIAEMPYTGASNGDITFTCSIDDLTASLTVEDCIIKYLTEQSYVSTTTTDVYNCLQPTMPDGNYELTFECKWDNHGSALGILNDSTHQKYIMLGKNSSTEKFYCSCGDTYKSGLGLSNNVWHTFKFKVNENSITVYTDEKLVGTKTLDTTGYTMHLGVNTWENVTVNVRNVKIKPLVA